MSGVLVFGEAQGALLESLSLEVARLGVDIASLLGTQVNGALIGSEIAQASSLFAGSGVKTLFAIDNLVLASYSSDLSIAAAQAIIEAAEPDLLIFPHTAQTMDWVPRLAARMNAGLVTNCSQLNVVQGRLIVTKPICGGAVQGEYGFETKLKMVTMAPGNAEPISLCGSAEIVAMEMPNCDSRVTLIKTLEQVQEDGPSLRTARVVVSGGVGIGSAESWKIVEDAAKSLGAAVGATRAAVEMGWVPATKQVGFSGLKVGADVYIAAGISGALHHLAGISRVKNVVAINEDAQANIFSVARYGVVGDAKKVIPAFVQRVEELRSGR